MRLRVLITSLIFGLFLAIKGVPRIDAAPSERPNILLIMSDDMGWSDLGCYGGEMETPNLDALAENGVRFTQFYNCARCCPTRASLLTGLYPHQAGMGHMTRDRGADGYRGDLNRQCVTIGEVLREANYRTYAIGKWHVTHFGGPSGPKHNWPLQRGFDKYYGLIWGACSFYDPAVCRGNEYFTCENDPEYQPEEFYFTDALSDNAVETLRQHENESPKDPFFMYVAYTAAHWPMQALEKDIAKYKGRFDAGYDALRKERIERLKKMGLIDPEWHPSPTEGSWEDVEHREWENRCMEVYAAMIDNMDQGIGRIMTELKRQNRLDNTLVFFLQDNGGCAENMGRRLQKELPKNIRPLEPDELPAGGHPKQTRDGRPMRHGPEVMPGGPDTYLAYGLGWANVSNTPFREYKHWVHEGGISTPLIVHWPEAISQARRNQLFNEPAHVIDIMATCADVGGATYPKEYHGESILPMQGISLRPALRGTSLNRQHPIFWEHEGNRAVREGQWKLVAKEDRPWELYDMEADRTEMNNLAEQHPEKIQQLAAKWDAWAARSNVLPLGTWKRSPEPKAAKSFFELKAGDELVREEGPVVGGRDVRIRAEILDSGTEGVIIAQGGKLDGYVLYVSQGRMHLAVRRGRKLTTLRAREPLPKVPFSVSAEINTDGSMTLLLNEQKIASSKTGGPLLKTPIDRLSVGKDFGDPVGDYSKGFPFNGTLGKVIVETKPKQQQK